MTRKPLLALVAAGLATLSLGLAACGSSSSSSGAATPADTGTTAATTPATEATTAGTAGATTTAPAAGASTVNVEADPGGQLKWTQTELTAAAGTVTVVMKNDSPVPHNIAVEGDGVQSEVSDTEQNGGTAEITVDLPAGTYTYYCDVPGHRQAGMEGTITVK